MNEVMPFTGDFPFVYHVLRYTSDLIRDEWLNVGVILFDPSTGAVRVRLVEDHEEYARLRRLQPGAKDGALGGFRDHLEDRFATFLRNQRAEQGVASSIKQEVQTFIEGLNKTLSTGLQLAPQRGVYANDLDLELERLYREHVAPPRKHGHVGASGNRAMMRHYCSQVLKTAGLWDRMQKSVRVSEFTFPGDPMRIDFCYGRNGARGYLQTISVSRSPADCKLYAYTSARIAARAPFRTEFTAITDTPLSADNERHCFVRDTLRDAGIEAIGIEHFAAWVPKLKPFLQ